MSKLYFRYGAMNCGKSTSLLQVAHNYEERGMKVLVMKPEVDNKGASLVVSRIGATREVDVLIDEKCNIYNDIKERLESKDIIDCILVDEVQFIKSEQVDQLLKIAVVLNIPVICYGLRTDFQMNGFEGSSRLLLIAHSIEELKNICSCGKKATLNGRKLKGRFVFSGKQIEIDNSEDISYDALCAKCYFELKGEI